MLLLLRTGQTTFYFNNILYIHIFILLLYCTSLSFSFINCVSLRYQPSCGKRFLSLIIVMTFESDYSTSTTQSHYFYLLRVEGTPTHNQVAAPSSLIAVQYLNFNTNTKIFNRLVQYCSSLFPKISHTVKTSTIPLVVYFII